MGRKSATHIAISMTLLVVIGGHCNNLLAAESKPIVVDLPRWNLHDALEELVKQTGIEVIADAYAKPRPKVAAANMEGQRFYLQAPSAEKVLDRLCEIFDYTWDKRDRIYLLYNNYSYQDAPYLVSNAVRQKVDALPKTLTFKQLAGFLDLKQEWVEALAEQRPQFILLSEKSPRRAEIAFYARLPDSLRAKLDKGEKVAYTELPKDVREQVWTTVKAQGKGITTEQVAKFVYRLKTDSKGWQYLQTLNLPNKLPAPKKKR